MIQTMNKSISIDSKQEYQYKTKIFSLKNFFIGFAISVTFHLFLILIFRNKPFISISSFWLFAFTDTILMGCNIVPMISCLKKEFVWYDPMLLFSIIFGLMTSTFFISYLIDPSFVQYYNSFGASTIRYLSESEYFILLIKAETILFVFLFIVLLINREYKVNKPYSVNPIERRISILTFVLLFFVIGLPLYISFISSRPVSYLESITIDIGSTSVKEYDEGTARYVILMEIGLISMSLGVAGYIGSLKKSPTLKGDVFLAFAILLTIFIQLANGSRISIVYTIVQYIFITKWFGYKTHKATWAVIGAISVLVIFAVTIIRGNPYLSYKPVEVIDQLVTGEAQKIYGSSINSPVYPILNPDRIGAVALITHYLDKTDSFVHGETLAAGFVNYFVNIISRIGVIDYERFVPLRLANEIIMIWFFGVTLEGGVLPSSIPGEFYMQWGILSLLALSLIFGYIIRFLRTHLSESTNTLSRWFLLVIVLKIIFLVPTEISPFFYSLLYYLVVAFVFQLFLTFIKLGRSY